MKLQISEAASLRAEQAIIISGSARGGSTILGKLLHSFEMVEYIFEPPMLFTLLPMIGKIPRNQWCLLYETYLYEEFLINAVSGRSINSNRNDDSSIYNTKTSEDVETRLSRTFSKAEAEKVVGNRIVAYKIPDVVPFLTGLIEYYPDMRVVIVTRDATGTLNSLIAKKWFSDENKNNNTIWPYQVHRGFQIPFWVKENDNDLWVEMSEINRCAYYYVRMNEVRYKTKNRIEINYNQLLIDPLGIVSKLAKSLNLEFGDKTEEIIAQITPTRRKRDDSIVEKVSPYLMEKVKFYSTSSWEN